MNLQVSLPEQTDSLVKPDMLAVLARTHLTVNISGLLLPVFEALSNSFDSIEQKFGDASINLGQILIKFMNISNPECASISIQDNGIGLDEENYKSFLTPFSGYKLSKRGRGFGRFIAFKVFDDVIYSSRFEIDGTTRTRMFRFDIAKSNEIVHLSADLEYSGCGVKVEFNQIKDEWKLLIENIDSEKIKAEIGSHFLPYFISKSLPKINIQFDDRQPENITSHFKALFAVHESGSFECEIDGQTHLIRYTLTKIPKKRPYRNHSMLFSAADRIVGHARDLSVKLGAAHFVNKNGENYIIIAVVRGDVFETRLNDSRTSIDLPPKAIESMVNSVCAAIQSTEKDQVQKIKQDQSRTLSLALLENPILKLGLKGQTLEDYVAKKPNHWGAEEFVQDLALARYRATGDLLKQIEEASSNANSYISKLNELAGKIDAGKKEALAEYVLHRKSIIELLDASRKFNSEEKRGTEDEIHSLIFRRFSDSAEVEYFQHNLWLIDDILAFIPYVSSDRTLHGGNRRKGDKVTDILFFDDSMILGDDEGASLAIVEFKRPSRDDYVFGGPKTDPVTQVIETLEKALSMGGISKTDGTHISFANVTRRQAFIIADITKSLVDVLKRHDFKSNYNPKIWYRYRDQEQVLIQVCGYDTLVETAKKRNQAFCTILLGE